MRNRVILFPQGWFYAFAKCLPHLREAQVGGRWFSVFLTHQSVNLFGNGNMVAHIRHIRHDFSDPWSESVNSLLQQFQVLTQCRLSATVGALIKTG
jgi:hypothetical protein